MTTTERLALARTSLLGLSVGDAFGIGSILVLSAGVNSIPQQWIAQTEPFESSPFFNQPVHNQELPKQGIWR